MQNLPNTQNRMNRIHNASNPGQGDAKRVLCVCSAGLLRSPTAANIIHQDYGYNTRACGDEPAFALVMFDEVLIQWADQIVCMGPENSKVVNRALDELDLNKEVVELDIQDSFPYMNKGLIELIRERYNG